MNTNTINLTALDYSILGIYILVVIGIGFVLKRHMKSASDFLMMFQRLNKFMSCQQNP
jgi:hypothetical protein